MPALSSMRPFIDNIADNIVSCYINNLLIKYRCIPTLEENSIEVNQIINLNTGTLDYQLLGLLGDKLDNPVVKYPLAPDLLRGLRRGEQQYNRHIRNIPHINEILPLVKEKYKAEKEKSVSNENSLRQSN